MPDGPLPSADPVRMQWFGAFFSSLLTGRLLWRGAPAHPVYRGNDRRRPEIDGALVYRGLGKPGRGKARGKPRVIVSVLPTHIGAENIGLSLATIVVEGIDVAGHGEPARPAILP